MKTNKLVLVGVLVVASVMIFTPAFAALTDSATISGSITEILEITIPGANQTITYSSFSPESTPVYSPNPVYFNVKSNNKKWKVYATDARTISVANSSAKGKMVDFYNGDYWWGVVLTSPLSIKTTTADGYVGSTSDLSTTSNLIASGDNGAKAVGAVVTVPFELVQTVAYTDAPSNGTYKMQATFTISTT